jgi:hypothetical protein
VYLGEVDAGELVHDRAHVEAERVGLLGPASRFGQWFLRCRLVRSQRVQRTLDLGVEFIDTSLIEVIQRQRLLQCEDVLGLVVANECGSNRPDAGLAVAIPHGRQYARVALSAHDGADDLHAGRSGDVSDDVMQLQVHEGQGLLHVLDVRCRVVHMPLTKPQIGAKCGNAAAWPEARTQQPTGVQALQPLRIIDIALAARHCSGLARIGHDHFNTTGLEDLVGRNPVHAGRLHRHGLDSQ